MVNGTLSYQLTPGFQFDFSITEDHYHLDNFGLIIRLGETFPPTEATILINAQRAYEIVEVCRKALGDYGDYKPHESENSHGCYAESRVCLVGHFIEKDIDFGVQCAVVDGSEDCFVIRLGREDVPCDILIFLSPGRLALFTDGLERFLQNLPVKVGES